MKYIGVIFIIIVACGSQKDVIDVPFEEPAPPRDLPMKIVEAKVTQEPFVNKVGHVFPDRNDLYLHYDDYAWFIKFSAGSVLRTDVEKLLDSTAKFSVIEQDGLWDTDNPEQQSRVGKFVSIHEIIY